MRDTKRGGGREKTKQRIKIILLGEVKKSRIQHMRKVLKRKKKMGEEDRKRKWLVVKLKGKGETS